MEIKTTVVGVCWAVTVIVGISITPPDNVRVRVSKPADGLEVITVTMPELDGVAERGEPEALIEEPGANGDWESGLAG